MESLRILFSEIILLIEENDELNMVYLKEFENQESIILKTGLIL